MKRYQTPIPAEEKGYILISERFHTAKGVYTITVRSFAGSVYYFKYYNGRRVDWRILK